MRIRAAATTVDITPPDGIHLHNWSYSTTPMSTGSHRPLEAKLVALADDRQTLLLVCLDLGWWMSAADEWAFRSVILDASGLDEQHVIVALTHTHSGPSITRADAAAPGGSLVGPYLDRIAASVAEAAVRTRAEVRPALLDWAYGSCDVAVNRDRRVGDRYVLAADASGESDSRLLVGRITAEDGGVIAVLANYAMHPTTLGGDNTLVSPDYIGAARALVEDDQHCVFAFLQGASGDLSPREQYVTDPEIPDRHGRALGYSVLGVLSGMLPAGTGLEYARTIESGAPLGVLSPVDRVASGPIAARRIEIDLPTQQNTPPASTDPGVQADRELRASRIKANVGESATVRFPLTMWTLGPATVAAYPGEAYSTLQKTIRAEHPGVPIVFANLANGPHQGYLPPAEAYVQGRYPAWQTPLGPGSLELLGSAIRSALDLDARSPSHSTSSRLESR